MKQFKLNGDYMTITQFLKLNDYIESGGEAKYFLLEYSVLINHEQVSERGKKIYANDIVSVKDDTYIIKHD